MSLVNLVLILVAVGVVLWLVNTYVPMDGKIKGILNAVVVIGVVIWLLQVFGLMSNSHRHSNRQVAQLLSHSRTHRSMCGNAGVFVSRACLTSRVMPAHWSVDTAK